MAVSREDVVAEIRRCAEENGGTPLGIQRFEAETGIGRSDWFGKYWARWGDALAEAGFAPNALQGAYPDDELLRHLALFVKEIGHFPVTGELKLRRRTHRDFPSSTTFERLGNRATIIDRLAKYCANEPEFEDVYKLCESIASVNPLQAASSSDASADQEVGGYVYLVRSGRHHKIGRTEHLGRRSYEIGIQLPEKMTLVHSFQTDDPVGIEHYWHERFADRRANGEWFALTPADVAAFKRRRRFM